MNSKLITWVLAAAAAALGIALAVVLLQRPQPQDGAGAPATGQPQPAASTSPPTATPTPSGQETDPAAEGGPLPSSEVQRHGDASPGATPYSQTDEARRQWQPVATGFGRAFTATDGKTADEWRKRLAPYVTAKVRTELASVDLRNVPQGQFTRLEPGEYGDDKVATFVHYDTGLTLVAYLILDGDSWRVYAYDRWED